MITLATLLVGLRFLEQGEIEAELRQRLAASATALKATIQSDFDSRDHGSFMDQLQACDLSLLGITFVAESAVGSWADPCALAGFDYSTPPREATFTDPAAPAAVGAGSLGQSCQALRVNSVELLRFRVLSISRDATVGEVPVTISWRCVIDGAHAAAVAEWAEPFTSDIQVAYPLDPSTVALWWTPTQCTVASGRDQVSELWDSAPPALAATVDLYDLLATIRSWHWCMPRLAQPPVPAESAGRQMLAPHLEAAWEVSSAGVINRTVTHRLDGAGGLRTITVEQSATAVSRRPLEQYRLTVDLPADPSSPDSEQAAAAEDWYPESSLEKWPGGIRFSVVMRGVTPTVDTGLPTTLDGVAQMVPDRIEVHRGGTLIHEIRFSAFERTVGVVPEWPSIPRPGPRSPWDDLSTTPDSIAAAIRLTQNRCAALDLPAMVPVTVGNAILSTETASITDLNEAERIVQWALNGRSPQELTGCAADLVQAGETNLALSVLCRLQSWLDLPPEIQSWVEPPRAHQTSDAH